MALERTISPLKTLTRPHISFQYTCYINYSNGTTNTYDHRLVRTGHPVRSAILKHQIGRLVVEWVTISEYLLLYVFHFCF